MNAIITGSSRGLGLAIATRFAQEGMNVAISSRKEADVLKAKKDIKKVNSKVQVLAHAVDFGDKNSVEAYVKHIQTEWKSIDIVVNNAGIYFEDYIDTDIEENLEKILNINLFSAVRINKAVIESMKKNKKGVIIHIVSIAAKQHREDAATYSISKMALKSYNDLMRDSLKKYGIKVIALYPGAMDTSSWDGISVDKNKMIQMRDMTGTIMNAINLSENTSIEEIIINTVQEL